MIREGHCSLSFHSLKMTFLCSSLTVEQIQEGMHLREADGSIGVVSRWKVVPGAKDMYNLEVEKDHTFTVGQGQYIVHNCAQPIKALIHPEAYEKAVKKIGEDGVQRFQKALGNGIVRSENQQGIKTLVNSDYKYELKVMSKQYKNWRFYGNMNDEGKIIFDQFGKAYH